MRRAVGPVLAALAFGLLGAWVGQELTEPVAPEPAPYVTPAYLDAGRL